jgi:tetratricopeptide (TPR) repeat protein/predicted aspartyl protease
MRPLTFLAVLSCLGLVWCAGSAAADCSFVQIAQVPVTIVDGRLIIPGKINGADVHIMIDTGSAFSLVTPAGAANYKMTVNGTINEVPIEGVGGEGALKKLATAKAFTVFGATFKDANFLVTDQGFGADAVVILGQNVLGTLDVEYDLAHGAVRLFRAKGCDHDNLAYWAGPTVPYSVMGIAGVSPQDFDASTTGKVTINGASIYALFDTGSQVSLLDLGAAARVGVKPTSPGVELSGTLGGIVPGRFVQTWSAPFASLKVGDTEEIKNIHLDIGALGDGPGEEMIIGEDFFLAHRILVSNSQHKLYLSYVGGPVFNVNGKDWTSHGAPGASLASGVVSADDHDRRAATASARRDYAGAIEDLNQAVQLDPQNTNYLYHRAVAEWRDGKSDLAKNDLDKVLSLEPSNIPSLVTRSELYSGQKKSDLAKADLAAAERLTETQPDMRLMVSDAYGYEGDLRGAIRQFGPWIDSHPHDDKVFVILNTRCWYRGLLGEDLDKALDDCNASLKLEPGQPATLDSRGLVRLRLGDYAGAIKDYDAALKQEPSSAWTFYGRGLAELRKGLKAQSDADLKAAAALSPNIAADAARWGLTP